MQIGERFTPMGLFTGIFIPDCIKSNRTLSSTDKMVWGQLNAHAGKDGKCFPKQSTLAEEIGCSERAVRESLNVLVDLKFLEVEKPQGKDRLLHANNSYHFIWNEIYESTSPTGKNCLPGAEDTASPNKGVNSKYKTQTSLSGENQDSLFLTLPATVKRPTRTKPFQSIANLLASIIQRKHRIKIPDYDVEKWRKEIKSFSESLDIPEERIKKVLDWYSDHQDDEYAYKVDNALHLKKKFLGIEEQMIKHQSKRVEPEQRRIPTYDDPPPRRRGAQVGPINR